MIKWFGSLLMMVPFLLKQQLGLIIIHSDLIKNAKFSNSIWKLNLVQKILRENYFGILYQQGID